MEQSHKPLKPQQPIPAISSEERSRICSIRVINIKDAWKCPAVKKELEWASEDKMESNLYKDKSIELRPIIQWARQIVRWPNDTVIKMLVEKGENNIYLILKPAMNNIHLRFLRDPYDVTRRHPQQIDLLTEISLDDATLESVANELSSIKLSEKADVEKIPKIRKLLTMFPMQDRFVALPWIVKAFSVERCYHLIQIELEADGPREPLLMHLFIGPKGAMVSIKGKKLERLSALFEKKTSETQYDPMTDAIGPPGQVPSDGLKRTDLSRQTKDN